MMNINNPLGLALNSFLGSTLPKEALTHEEFTLPTKQDTKSLDDAGSLVASNKATAYDPANALQRIGAAFVDLDSSPLANDPGLRPEYPKDALRFEPTKYHFDTRSGALRVQGNDGVVETTAGERQAIATTVEDTGKNALKAIASVLGKSETAITPEDTAIFAKADFNGDKKIDAKEAGVMLFGATIDNKGVRSMIGFLPDAIGKNAVEEIKTNGDAAAATGKLIYESLFGQ
jgi:hypothetical protein